MENLKVLQTHWMVKG